MLRPPPSEFTDYTLFNVKKLLQSNNIINNLPRLIGDERRLKQVLINLVKNALKFTSKGLIAVKATYDTSMQCLIVHVQDTGVGIEAEDIPKLFSKFGKLHRTAEINSEGIGLGLTIVKQIVEASGGYVTVESDGSGKGSLFIFSMKMKLAPAI